MPLGARRCPRQLHQAQILLAVQKIRKFFLRLDADLLDGVDGRYLGADLLSGVSQACPSRADMGKRSKAAGVGADGIENAIHVWTNIIFVEKSMNKIFCQ